MPLNDREARREYQRDYARKHSTAARERSRAWRRNNPERAAQNSRRTHLRLKYGITLEQYDEMFEAQGGVCALCARPPGQRRLAVDHDHTTGRVRGLLCEMCNHRLAAVDNLEWLQRAVEYVTYIPRKGFEEVEPIVTPN